MTEPAPTTGVIFLFYSILKLAFRFLAKKTILFFKALAADHHSGHF